MHRFFAFGALGAAPLASFAFAFGFLACSSSTPPGNVDAGDGGADATLDAPQGNDAVADTTLEASSEASADGGSEASNPPPFGDAAMDAWPDAPPGPSNPCQLPGSIQFTTTGKVTVPGGGASWPDLSFLTLQTGFCAHHFATVPNARQIRFAPGGELFVASPTTGTTGGGQGGKAAIVVLPDDNLDGVADTTTTFLGSLPSTQGLLFANGYFYYQDGTKIMRLAYAAGERVASGTPEQVADITVYTSSLHWPKTLDIADDGTIYVGNGGDQGETCDPAHPFHGGILSLGSGSTTSATQVAKGLRNPITVRCARGHNRCFALELAKDYSSGDGGGREKLLPIHAGDDWGFPCCATTNLPYVGTPAGTDCSGRDDESPLRRHARGNGLQRRDARVERVSHWRDSVRARFRARALDRGVEWSRVRRDSRRRRVVDRSAHRRNPDGPDDGADPPELRY